MKKEDKKTIDLAIRYLIIILSSIGGLAIFYIIFTPLTIYSVYFISKIFTNPEISRNLIIFGEDSFEFVSACIAGSAYFILLMLNLSTPDIPIKKRILSLLSSFLIFLVLNIFRILLLIFIYLHFQSLFFLTHILFWYALSTVFVLLIWFAEIRYFRIKSIPFYSDLSFLYRKSKFKKK